MMDRRVFLNAMAGAGSALALARAQSRTSSTTMAPELIRPKVLRPGETVALITPSTYVSNPESIELARRTVEFLGLKLKMGKNVGKRTGYVGGTPEERAEDIHWAFSDPEVKAVFAMRGGYGSAQTLDRLDFDLIRRNPKIFTGYSDITAMHLAIHQKAGLVTFHGPTTLSRFNDYTLDCFKKAIFGTGPLGKLANPDESSSIRPRHLTRTLRGGSARGRLTGGNLTLISTTMGTPYEIQTDGRLLFLEDVDEQPYSMDRMLTQLRLAGKFRNITGLIIGECAGCQPRDYKPSFESTFSLGEVFQNLLGDLKVPVVTGMVIGHTEDQMTLPLGVMANLDADKVELTIEEPAVTA